MRKTIALYGSLDVVVVSQPSVSVVVVGFDCAR